MIFVQGLKTTYVVEMGKKTKTKKISFQHIVASKVTKGL